MDKCNCILHFNTSQSVWSKENREINKNCNILMKYDSDCGKHFREVFKLQKDVTIYDYVCVNCQNNMPQYKLNVKKMELLALREYLEKNLREQKQLEKQELEKKMK